MVTCPLLGGGVVYANPIDEIINVVLLIRALIRRSNGEAPSGVQSCCIIMRVTLSLTATPTPPIIGVSMPHIMAPMMGHRSAFTWSLGRMVTMSDINSYPPCINGLIAISTIVHNPTPIGSKNIHFYNTTLTDLRML